MENAVTLRCEKSEDKKKMINHFFGFKQTKCLFSRTNSSTKAQKKASNYAHKQSQNGTFTLCKIAVFSRVHERHWANINQTLVPYITVKMQDLKRWVYETVTHLNRCNEWCFVMFYLIYLIKDALFNFV